MNKPKGRTTSTFTIRVNTKQKRLVDGRCQELGIARGTYIKDLIFRDLLGRGITPDETNKG